MGLKSGASALARRELPRNVSLALQLFFQAVNFKLVKRKS